ncbi:MAG: methyltransferase family protein [Candidatus Kariarchaeaceae archaeon]|jgi:protein-S-isoprenylcysteine O-methyltransferase Ste14
MAFKYYPPFYFLVSLISGIILHFIYPIITFLRFPLNLLGILPIIFGLYMASSVNAAIVREGTTIVSDEKPTVFINTGVFRISRNPMYLGSVVLLMGVALLLGSLVAFLPSIALFLILDRKFIPVEERNLKKEFGEEFQKYSQRVRRWI